MIDFKNTSVTAILYKEKGDTDDLKNYHPISPNVDLKILTKTLINRLKKVPPIIHFKQTAVDGQKIDNTRFYTTSNENLESTLIFFK